MTYNPNLKSMVCNSCGLSLTRYELDNYWKKIKEQNLNDADESEKSRQRKKEWLEWYSRSKEDKERY
ncbi:MAG: hypothetical protein EU543_03870 [Promethearchaeota archaeon]|nr:MAG: hypothetical protein EU543_03870 [Candidatus Lokiarchaeota archaeon]